MMSFNDWFVYNRINEPKKITMSLDNIIELKDIGLSLKKFWLDYFDKMSDDEKFYYKAKYNKYLFK